MSLSLQKQSAYLIVRHCQKPSHPRFVLFSSTLFYNSLHSYFPCVQHECSNMDAFEENEGIHENTLNIRRDWQGSTGAARTSLRWQLLSLTIWNRYTCLYFCCACFSESISCAGPYWPNLWCSGIRRDHLQCARQEMCCRPV